MLYRECSIVGKSAGWDNRGQILNPGLTSYLLGDLGKAVTKTLQVSDFFS